MAQKAAAQRTAQTVIVGASVIGAIAGLGSPAASQIIEDGTLGTERSRLVQGVEVRGAQGDRIDGGALRGSNLFHSFREFNVNEGQRVYFSNPAGVETILTRVTGAAASDILGTLGVDGSANLFLMNPNGIFFGPNARLDVRGSFVATTADTLQFDEQDFSARRPQAPSRTLTINPTAFVFNQLNQPRGDIRSEAIARDPATNLITNGLTVPEGESLVLLGGDVTIDGGYLRAEGGRVELGGLDEPGSVTLRLSQDNSRLRLTYPETLRRSDVTLTNGAVLDVTGDDGGDVRVTAANINVLNGSNICAGLGATTFCGQELQDSAGSANSEAGNIVLLGTDTVLIQGNGTGVRNRVNPGAQGNNREPILEVVARLTDSDTANADDPVDVLYGSILIGGATIQVLDNAEVGTSTEGRGNAGLLYLLGGDVRVAGGAVLDSNVLGAVGQAGGILIDVTGNITVEGVGADGGPTSVESGTAGRGDAGLVSLRGNTVTVRDGGRLSSAVFQEGVGNAGGIAVQATNLFVTGGGYVDASTFNRGSAGNVVLTVGRLVVDGIAANALADGFLGDEERSRITSTVGGPTQAARGRGGNIVIGTTESVNILNGALINTSTYSRGRGGDILVVAGGDVVVAQGSGIASAALINATADSGRIGIVAGGAIAVVDGSFITTTALPLDVAARDLALVSGGPLFVRGRSVVSAQTRSGDGGNIFLGGRNFLILADGSNIATDAGLAERGGGDGGNIDLDVGRLVWGIPFNDNNISAQANLGNGGNITFLSPVRLEDIAERPDVPITNDITASSRFGISGTITVNELDVNPVRGINELPVEVVSAEDLITQACPSLGSQDSGEAGSFYVTGSGGVPIAPDDPSSSSAVIANWISLDGTATTDAPQPVPRAESNPPMEFQDWAIAEDGSIWLVANQTPSSLTYPSLPYCP